MPYRERRKEQKRHGLGEGGDDLDIDAEEGEDADTPLSGKRNRDTSSPAEDDQAEDEDGYYELVRTAKKQRKEEKKAEYEAMRAAERFVFHRLHWGYLIPSLPPFAFLASIPTRNLPKVLDR